MLKRLVLAGCLAVASVGLVSGQAGRPPASPQRALLDQYCVTCHNEKLKTANLLLDKLDLARIGDQAEVAEKVVPEASRGPDAALGYAAAGSGDARDARHLAGKRARSSGRHASACPRASSPEPHRVRERDPRRARAGSGCGEISAVGRLDARLRQHRGDAGDVAGADGGVPVGGGKDQPPGDWQRDGSDAGGVRGAGRRHAELSR